jgi:hypothetical protein
MQQTAEQMLTRARITWERHGSGWGMYVDGEFLTPVEAINFVIDRK